MEERNCAVLDHAQHCVLPEDLVLVLHDAVDVFHVVRVVLVVGVGWYFLFLLFVRLVVLVRWSWVEERDKLRRLAVLLVEVWLVLVSAFIAIQGVCLRSHSRGSIATVWLLWLLDTGIRSLHLRTI